MKEKRFFNRYLMSVSFTAFIVTSCLGCLVYSKMGTKTPRIFLKALIHEFPLIRILLALYSLFLFLNYQYMLFPAYQIVVEERQLLSKTFSVSTEQTNP